MALLKEKLDNVLPTTGTKFFAEELAENAVPPVWDESTEPKLDQGCFYPCSWSSFSVWIDLFPPQSASLLLCFGRELFEIAEDLKDTVDQVSATTGLFLSVQPWLRRQLQGRQSG